MGEVLPFASSQRGVRWEKGRRGGVDIEGRTKCACVERRGARRRDWGARRRRVGAGRRSAGRMVEERIVSALVGLVRVFEGEADGRAGFYG